MATKTNISPPGGLVVVEDRKEYTYFEYDFEKANMVDIPGKCINCKCRTYALLIGKCSYCGSCRYMCIKCIDNNIDRNYSLELDDYKMIFFCSNECRVKW